ncbi:MAG: lipoprotein insertase outer membrane protein LolB [Dokdonella sp.]|uniref:lipoprotein insertase outer membrane protein LolB n=1 Tax=Dokdonella sp. TaxID=2291710 RepID=UPI003267426D
MKPSRIFFATLSSLLLAACAGRNVRPLPADADLLSKQATRERALATRTTWTLKGRLGVSDGHDSGSGALEWQQTGSRYRFSVHAPVTGKTWVLSGEPGHAVLEGLRDAVVEGGDAAALLERELGWRVPVAQLVHWVRGARAGGAAQIRFRADGLPAEIDEDGWTVEYLDYGPGEPAQPSKVFASKGDYKVRLSIREWAGL